MNVPFYKMDTSDAARIIGVNYATVANWCNKKIINCEDISGGTGKSRYMIAEEEVYYLKELQKKYGTKKLLLYYDKNHFSEQNTSVSSDNSEVLFDMGIRENDTKSIEKPKKEIDVEGITNTFLYIKDLKERLEDIEAEKNQIKNELQSLKQEVIDIIDD